MVTIFGSVSTLLQQACFDTEADRVIMNSGRIIDDYYRQKLGVKYYHPIAKSNFPECPSGWCSWPYYGHDVTPEEVLLNAGWIRDNLKEYGVGLILLDDGWQTDMRDWEGVQPAFGKGMQWLAHEIRAMGMMPGLWICPHGQDNQAFIEKAGGFMECKTFGGPFTVDPTSPKGIDYLVNLTRKITREWGYAFLKLDGIHFCAPGYGVLEAYRHNRHLLADPSVSGDEAFRRYLEAVRQGAGPGVAIGGCGVLCFESAGLCHSNRTGNDTNPELRHGLLNAVSATMSGYFMHNIVWHSDPDCCLFRPPLAFSTAQAWATLMGLTGQMLLLGDRMPDLGPERVALVKKICPPAEIMPFDLFPSSKRKRIFDLKINHLGRNYDVVGIFNYDENTQRSEHLRFRTLGISGDRFHVYDFWNDDYLGLHADGLFVEVPPGACRLLTIYPEDDFPVLLSTNRHVLQGWPDIQFLKVDKEQKTIRGRSQCIAGEPYTLTFAMPVHDGKTFKVDQAGIEGEENCMVSSGRGCARISWTPKSSGICAWKISFREDTFITPHYTGSSPYWIGRRDLDPWTVEISWTAAGSPAGFLVKQNGQRIGTVFANRIQIGGLAYKSRHVFEVGVTDLNGEQRNKPGSIEICAGETLPESLCLSDMEWDSAVNAGHLFVSPNRNIGGLHLCVAGKSYAKGIGACSDSKVIYNVHGIFKKMTGGFGIDDISHPFSDKTKPEQAVFRIVADGRELLASDVKTHGEQPSWFELDIQGIQTIELIVNKPCGFEEVFADWLELKLLF